MAPPVAWSEGGGLEPGARVWVPVAPPTSPRGGGPPITIASATQPVVGWVRARVVRKEEGADVAVDFVVVEDGGAGGSLAQDGLGGREGDERVVRTRRSEDGDFELIKLANVGLEEAGAEGEASSVADLIRLPHLHEPAILHTLELRYWRDIIYTYTGPILIAVNPFKRLPLYTDHSLDAYRQAGLRSQARLAGDGGNGSSDMAALPPHIFAVADNAYRAMTTSGAGQQVVADQSILVSGESGAGKTESTKFIMQYLAVISSQQGLGSKPSEQPDVLSLSDAASLDRTIASQVLQSNPILESFGNARTLRNDNSSRFGKFIEIHFSTSSGHLCGASISTYLLEKVRIVSQCVDERNYHVFYELVKGAGQEEREDLCLGHCHDYHYLAQSQCFARKDGADDAAQYRRMRQAMDIMGFSGEEQSAVMRVVAAVLHIGNLRFQLKQQTDPNSPEAAMVCEESMAVLALVARLLEVDFDEFHRALTYRNIQAAREVVVKERTPAEAELARDALAKAVYGGLFLWVVSRINATIHARELQQAEDDSRGAASSSSFRTPIKASAPTRGQQSFIGVLDIFGFESFVRNSFEQLCINYCNETLQQQFNQFVFKLEQEEYEREAILWSFISFPDNQDCLELIENRTQGLLALLDEQCVVPKATDMSYAGRLYEKCLGQHGRFSVSAKDRVDYRFTIRHYAGAVTYDTTGFLEKNRDQLYQELIDLLQGSTSDLVCSLMAQAEQQQQDLPPGTPHSLPRSTSRTTNPSTPLSASGGQGSSSVKRRGSAVAPLTVGSQFKGQLALLLTKIRATRPHYVRCLKPNDRNVAAAFDQTRVIEQLRCGGVLEAVRVSRSGYPTRMTHSQLYQRYRMLSLEGFDAALKHAKTLGLAHGSREMDRVLGEAVVKGLADRLEQGRTRDQREEEAKEEDGAKEEAGGGKVSGLAQRLAEVGLQFGRTKAFFRMQAFEEAEMMRSRMMRSRAVVLQSRLRGWVRRCVWVRMRSAAVTLQCAARQVLSRRKATYLRRTRAAVKAQRCVRRHLAERRYRRARQAIITMQALARRRAATTLAQALRRERASVKLQSWVRMARARAAHRWARRAIIIVQSVARRRAAKLTLKHLKQEARDLGKVAQERDRLQQAVLGLKEELRTARTEADDAKKQVAELQAMLSALQKQQEQQQRQSQTHQREVALSTSASLETSTTTSITTMAATAVPPPLPSPPSPQATALLSTTALMSTALMATTTTTSMQSQDDEDEDDAAWRSAVVAEAERLRGECARVKAQLEEERRERGQERDRLEQDARQVRSELEAHRALVRDLQQQQQQQASGGKKGKNAGGSSSGGQQQAAQVEEQLTAYQDMAAKILALEARERSALEEVEALREQLLQHQLQQQEQGGQTGAAAQGEQGEEEAGVVAALKQEVARLRAKLQEAGSGGRQQDEEERRGMAAEIEALRAQLSMAGGAKEESAAVSAAAYWSAKREAEQWKGKAEEAEARAGKERQLARRQMDALEAQVEQLLVEQEQARQQQGGQAGSASSSSLMGSLSPDRRVSPNKTQQHGFRVLFDSEEAMGGGSEPRIISGATPVPPSQPRLTPLSGALGGTGRSSQGSEPSGVDLETGTLSSSAASGTSILRDRFFSAVSSEVAASEDGSTLSQVSTPKNVVGRAVLMLDGRPAEALSPTGPDGEEAAFMEGVGGMEGMLLMGPGRSPEEEGAEAGGQGGRQGASTSGSPAAFLTSDSPLPPSAILAWDDHHSRAQSDIIRHLEDLRDGASSSLSVRFSASVMEAMPVVDCVRTLAQLDDHSDVVLEMIRHKLSLESEERRVDVVNAKDRDGRTPLHHACMRGSHRIADLLLQSGAGPQVADRDSDTPLHLSGSVEVTRVLLKHGANPNIPNKDRQVALHAMIRNGDCESVLAIVEGVGHRPSTALMVDATDASGQAPLHMAVNKGLVDAVCALCEHGADVGLVDGKGRTPLHLCCSLLHPVDGQGRKVGSRMVKILLGHGADREAQCRDSGLTPLHCLAMNQAHAMHPEEVLAMAKLLLSAGASANVKAKDGSTPLHHAALSGSEELCELLLRHGACMTIPWKPVASDRGGGGSLGGWMTAAGSNGAWGAVSYGGSSFSGTGATIKRRIFHMAQQQQAASSSSSQPSPVAPPCLLPSLDSSYYYHYASNGRHSSSSYVRGGAGGLLSGSEAEEGGGPPDVLAVDVFARSGSLQRMVSAISAPQEEVKDSAKKACMECNAMFTLNNRRHHCRFCKRLLCHSCSSVQLDKKYYPPQFVEPRDGERSRTCDMCHDILKARFLQRQQEAAAAGHSSSTAGGQLGPASSAAGRQGDSSSSSTPPRLSLPSGEGGSQYVSLGRSPSPS